MITDEALTMAAGPDNADAAVAQTFLTDANPAQAASGTTSQDTSDDTATEDEGQQTPAAAAGEDAAGEDGAARTAGEVGGGPDDSAEGGIVADAREALRWYGDSAYGTGDLRDAIERAGDQAVIKPKPVQPAVVGGFTVDDFTVDEAAGTASCPAGQTRPVSPGRSVSFGGLCRDCPLRDRCTTAKTGRTLVLHERDDLLRAARADWAADPGLREDYRHHRPNIERVVSQVASQGGQRVKLRYHGTTKNHAWLKRRTAALNLRNLIGRGLTYLDRTWALA